MPARKLILHIGLHKTGTSAIQKFLMDNRGHLAEQGLLYPASGLIGANHNSLSWHLMDKKYYPKNNDVYLRNASSGAAWADLAAELAQADADTVMLSGEDFCLVTDPSLIARLCEAFVTRIVVYLRRQDQYLQSIYNEDVKNHPFMRTDTFEEFVKNHRLMDIVFYDRFLERWAGAFGKENITVGLYDKSRLQQGLIADFAARAGITISEQMIGQGRAVNTSLPDHLIEIKRVLNHIPFSAEQNAELVGILENHLSGHRMRQQVFSEHGLISRAEQRDLMEQFREANRAVARDYVGEDSCLFPEIEDEPSSGPESSQVIAGALPDSKTLLEQIVGPVLFELTRRMQDGRASRSVKLAAGDSRHEDRV